nr:immunoglobulin heavy chain junction region [Macaca mulatta]MOW79947.1 immunoglobulin heavy chain junction region [Macaca mulatta]MOW81248.1 immunoglobulin heavy chain junction region [Macaca mulatta]MOW81412.1 immunoglobulin heavy chain junction region [Macaca mulatta]MOW81441.1 immunoglobulin heavy chain junction region [Macaca mulatta]
CARVRYSGYGGSMSYYFDYW